MNITNAFLDQIKKQTWPIHYIESGGNYRIGEHFKVVMSRKNDIKAIILLTAKGKERYVYEPLKGSAKVEMSDNDILMISFKYKPKRGAEKRIALRFFFFKHDPTLFRFLDIFVSEEEECCCTCCCGCLEHIVLYSSQGGDEDKGGGGPHTIFN